MTRQAEAAPRFRILTFGGRRRSFALEQDFWRVLESRAAAENKRLSHFVADILEREPGDANATAALRLAALIWLRDEKARLETDQLASLKRVISAVPGPAFSVDSNQLVIAQNRAFQTLRSSEASDSVALATVRLGVALARLQQVLAEQSDRAVSIPFALLSGRGRMTGQLNVTIMASSVNRPLYLCIVRRMDDQ
jgi:predicted DNA-binding ribbon-helix-helix protein